VLVGVRDRPLVVKAEQPGFCRYEETDVSSDLSTSHTHTKSQLRAHTMRKHKMTLSFLANLFVERVGGVHSRASGLCSFRGVDHHVH